MPSKGAGSTHFIGVSLHFGARVRVFQLRDTRIHEVLDLSRLLGRTYWYEDDAKGSDAENLGAGLLSHQGHLKGPETSYEVSPEDKRPPGN